MGVAFKSDKMANFWRSEFLFSATSRGKEKRNKEILLYKLSEWHINTLYITKQHNFLWELIVVYIFDKNIKGIEYAKKKTDQVA